MNSWSPSGPCWMQKVANSRPITENLKPVRRRRTNQPFFFEISSQKKSGRIWPKKLERRDGQNTSFIGSFARMWYRKGLDEFEFLPNGIIWSLEEVTTSQCYSCTQTAHWRTFRRKVFEILILGRLCRQIWCLRLRALLCDPHGIPECNHRSLPSFLTPKNMLHYIESICNYDFLRPNLGVGRSVRRRVSEHAIGRSDPFTLREAKRADGPVV